MQKLTAALKSFRQIRAKARDWTHVCKAPQGCIEEFKFQVGRGAGGMIAAWLLQPTY